jgi:hypothetical protein
MHSRGLIWAAVDLMSGLAVSHPREAPLTEKAGGNAHFEESFPELDSIKRATVFAV